MPPVSREQRLIAFLRTRSTRPTRELVASHLEEWMTHEQAMKTIDQAIADSSAVRVAPGGRLVYWDTEHGSGTTLYSTVGRVIEKRWAERGLRLRGAQVVRPLHGRNRADGSRTGTPSRAGADRTWTRPDLVMAAYPRRRRSANDPKDLHALEVERESGFDIRSVYQAHEQARGAHFAWVFAHAADVQRRVRVAAQELGVGIVIFSNPNSEASYRLVEPALLRVDVDPNGFMDRCFRDKTEKLSDWRPVR